MSETNASYNSTLSSVCLFKVSPTEPKFDMSTNIKQHKNIKKTVLYTSPCRVIGLQNLSSVVQL